MAIEASVLSIYNKDQDTIIVYVHASSHRGRRRRILRRRDDNAPDRRSSRANRGGKACDLHLTATFAFTCLLLLLLPAPGEGGKKREKERSRGEKEASVLGFSLAKRPRGSGTTGEKKTRRGAEGGSGTVEKPAAASS